MIPLRMTAWGLAYEDGFLAVLDADERAALERIMAKLMIRPEDADRQG